MPLCDRHHYSKEECIGFVLVFDRRIALVSPRRRCIRKGTIWQPVAAPEDAVKSLKSVMGVGRGRSSIDGILSILDYL